MSASRLAGPVPGPVDYGQALLGTVCRRLPVVVRTLSRWGRLPLRDYLRHTLSTVEHGYQPRADLGAAVQAYAAPLLGAAAARRAGAALVDTPVALTANHHGVDYFAQSVQGSLLFALGAEAGVVPVLACAGVPLNNITYPRGALLYATDPDRAPLRLPLFPDRYKRQLVCRAPALDRTMVERAGQRLARLSAEGRVDTAAAAALATLLEEDYGAAEVQALDSYSAQAVVLNRRLWRRLFAAPSRAPELAYLEFEKVAGLLLEADLGDRHSLAWRLICRPGPRRRLLRALDGARACWRLAALQQRAAGGIGPEAQGGGTFLFWGLDEAGRRVALAPDQEEDGEVLTGRDEAGNLWTVPLFPPDLIEGLRGGRLLPSLFTCYLVTALARGVTCAGGYYQAQYLPAMGQGVIAALSGDAEPAAAAVAAAPADAYLSGMQAVLRAAPGGGLVPAGPVEIIAAGGLDAGHLERMLAMTVAEAHLASLSETIPDAAPEAAAEPGWAARLAAACGRELRDPARLG